MANESAPRRARAPRGQGDKLRAQIKAAAEQLLLETGDEASVSIRAIAERVGCTPPAIYMHFADKDDLFFEVCEDKFRELNRHFEKTYGQTEDPLAHLQLLGRAYIRFAMENPEHYRVIMMTKSEMTPEEYLAEGQQGTAAFMHLVQAVQACIGAGLFLEEDATLVAVGMWASVHGLASLMITTPQFPWPADMEAMHEHLMNVHLRGILKEPELLQL